MVQVTPDKQQWMAMACGDTLNKETVKRVQGALISKGFDLKTVDGVAGKGTYDAIDSYQASLGFKTKGIAIKTLGSLGIQQE